jgi:acetyl esterase/lipase
MSDDVRRAIRAMGAQFTPEVIGQTQALYAPLVPRPDASRVERDLAYGPDPRHRLDVFRPAAGESGAPVVVFVHGGGFIGGDKGAEGAPYYNNVGAWAAGQGFVGVNITYRLAPAHPWPAGAEDLGLAVDWLRTHRADPVKIVVAGQSAGAAHVASYLALSPHPPVAGAAMFSGLYDVVNLEHAPMEHAYYGTDPARFAAQSSLAGLVESDIPCLFTVCEFDPPKFQAQARLLIEAWWAAKGALPRLIQLTDHNHLSSVSQIGSASDTLGPELAAFVRRVAT